VKKHILLLTGRAAASEAKKIAAASSIPVVVRVCDIDVAAFMSTQAIEKELSSADLSDTSMAIVSGAVSGDLSSIRTHVRVPCFKGPRNISDLPLVLGEVAAGRLKLSHQIPADKLLEKEIKKRVEDELAEARSSKRGYLMKIGKKNPVYVGTGLMRVVAEINNAPTLSSENVSKMASYYVASGASIIDLGMIYGVDNSADVSRLVSAVRSAVKAPVSIDSLNSKEILAAADAGVDLILSLDYTNYEIASSLDVPAVIIPRTKDGVPKEASKRISLIEGLMKKLDGYGFSDYIADLVLEPPFMGLTESFEAYGLFRKKHPRVPMFFGAGNVSEMIDADSPGVNALLASVAGELGVDLLFTVEASGKTRGSVRELSVAADMMYLAKKRKAPPKDLGVDLLQLKDKRKAAASGKGEKAHVIAASHRPRDVLEDAHFRITVSDRIEVLYAAGKKQKLRFTGSSAESLYKEILSRKLIKSMSHAAYLGRELAKAEIALKLGKAYVQDEELF
jgi:dihydropteroate synthase-like protein